MSESGSGFVVDKRLIGSRITWIDQNEKKFEGEIMGVSTDSCGKFKFLIFFDDKDIRTYSASDCVVLERKEDSKEGLGVSDV